MEISNNQSNTYREISTQASNQNLNNNQQSQKISPINSRSISPNPSETLVSNINLKVIDLSGEIQKLLLKNENLQSQLDNQKSQNTSLNLENQRALNSNFQLNLEIQNYQKQLNDLKNSSTNNSININNQQQLEQLKQEMLQQFDEKQQYLLLDLKQQLTNLQKKYAEVQIEHQNEIQELKQKHDYKIKQINSQFQNQQDEKHFLSESFTNQKLQNYKINLEFQESELNQNKLQQNFSKKDQIINKTSHYSSSQSNKNNQENNNSNDNEDEEYIQDDDSDGGMFLVQDDDCINNRGKQYEINSKLKDFNNNISTMNDRESNEYLKQQNQELINKLEVLQAKLLYMSQENKTNVAEKEKIFNELEQNLLNNFNKQQEQTLQNLNNLKKENQRLKDLNSTLQADILKYEQQKGQMQVPPEEVLQQLFDPQDDEIDEHLSNSQKLKRQQVLNDMSQKTKYELQIKHLQQQNEKLDKELEDWKLQFWNLEKNILKKELQESANTEELKNINSKEDLDSNTIKKDEKNNENQDDQYDQDLQNEELNQKLQQNIKFKESLLEQEQQQQEEELNQQQLQNQNQLQKQSLNQNNIQLMQQDSNQPQNECKQQKQSIDYIQQKQQQAETNQIKQYQQVQSVDLNNESIQQEYEQQKQSIDQHQESLQQYYLQNEQNHQMSKQKIISETDLKAEVVKQEQEELQKKQIKAKLELQILKQKQDLSKEKYKKQQQIQEQQQILQQKQNEHLQIKNNVNSQDLTQIIKKSGSPNSRNLYKNESLKLLQGQQYIQKDFSPIQPASNNNYNNKSKPIQISTKYKLDQQLKNIKKQSTSSNNIQPDNIKKCDSILENSNKPELFNNLGSDPNSPILDYDNQNLFKMFFKQQDQIKKEEVKKVEVKSPFIEINLQSKKNSISQQNNNIINIKNSNNIQNNNKDNYNNNNINNNQNQQFLQIQKIKTNQNSINKSQSPHPSVNSYLLNKNNNSNNNKNNSISQQNYQINLQRFPQNKSPSPNQSNHNNYITTTTPVSPLYQNYSNTSQHQNQKIFGRINIHQNNQHFSPQNNNTQPKQNTISYLHNNTINNRSPVSPVSPIGYNTIQYQSGSQTDRKGSLQNYPQKQQNIIQNSSFQHPQQQQQLTNLQQKQYTHGFISARSQNNTNNNSPNNMYIQQSPQQFNNTLNITQNMFQNTFDGYFKQKVNQFRV